MNRRASDSTANRRSWLRFPRDLWREIRERWPIYLMFMLVVIAYGMQFAKEARCKQVGQIAEWCKPTREGR